MSPEALDEDDRRHRRWPAAVLSKLEDHGGDETRPFREVADGPGVEDQLRHSGAPAHPGAPRVAEDPSHASSIRRRGRSDLSDERRDVAIRLAQEVLPAQLETNCSLEQLGSR
jgi:hypothetical protein